MWSALAPTLQREENECEHNLPMVRSDLAALPRWCKRGQVSPFESRHVLRRPAVLSPICWLCVMVWSLRFFALPLCHWHRQTTTESCNRGADLVLRWRASGSSENRTVATSTGTRPASSARGDKNTEKSATEAQRADAPGTESTGCARGPTRGRCTKERLLRTMHGSPCRQTTNRDINLRHAVFKSAAPQLVRVWRGEPCGPPSH